jgi:hypothetical protein
LIVVSIYLWNIPPFIPTLHVNIIPNPPKPVSHPVPIPDYVVLMEKIFFPESYTIINPKTPPTPSHKERNHN